MNNEKSRTPLIVGVVIALLGILAGLYFAENARQQMAATAQDKNLATQQKSDSHDGEMPVEQIEEELPPLEPVVVDRPAMEKPNDPTVNSIDEADVNETMEEGGKAEESSKADTLSIPEESAKEDQTGNSVANEKEQETVPEKTDSI